MLEHDDSHADRESHDEEDPREPITVHLSPGPPDGDAYSAFDFPQGYAGTEQ
jgi:hypothetical protein